MWQRVSRNNQSLTYQFHLLAAANQGAAANLDKLDLVATDVAAISLTDPFYSHIFTSSFTHYQITRMERKRESDAT